MRWWSQVRTNVSAPRNVSSASQHSPLAHSIKILRDLCGKRTLRLGGKAGTDTNMTFCLHESLRTTHAILNACVLARSKCSRPNTCTSSQNKKCSCALGLHITRSSGHATVLINNEGSARGGVRVYNSGHVLNRSFTRTTAVVRSPPPQRVHQETLP